MTRSPGTDSQDLVANIGPRERRKRLLTGIVMLIVAAGGLAALVATGVNRAWRVALFAPLWVAALGFLQARACT